MFKTQSNVDQEFSGLESALSMGIWKNTNAKVVATNAIRKCLRDVVEVRKPNVEEPK